MMLEIEVPAPSEAIKTHIPYPACVKRVQAAFGELFATAERMPDPSQSDEVEEYMWWCEDADRCSLAITYEDGFIQNIYPDFYPERTKGYFCLGLELEQVEQHSTAHERTQWQLEFCEKHDQSLWPETWRKEMEKTNA